MAGTRSFAWRALGIACVVSPLVSAQTTEIASVSDNGVVSNGANFKPVVSADGRYVAFYSNADNLVALPDITGFTPDVFVRDRLQHVTTRISIPAPGSGSANPHLSGDGRFISYSSFSNNQVPVDTNLRGDVFLHDQQTHVTTLVSVDSNGVQGNDHSLANDISGDGQVIVFESDASNLVLNDTNGAADVFVHYVQSGLTTRVSVDSAGNQATGDSDLPAISADGRFVAFQSVAADLVANDTNGVMDVFVHDLVSGVTTRESSDSAGVEGVLRSQQPALSADGRFFGFRSSATNLVLNDTNGFDDIFVRDRATGSVQRVNVSSAGAQANGESAYAPSFSADGRFVSFDSGATNLVPNDANGGGNFGRDVFMRDLLLGTTTLISVDTFGVQANDFSNSPTRISSGGNVIVFTSVADNLAPGDTNDLADVYVRELCAAVSTFHPDADGDGYGDSGVATSSCSQPAGYVADGTDCDDANASVHPGALELCNALDDDCDGEIDEGFTPVSYCTPSTTVQLCSPTMSANGTASATAGAGFTLAVTDVDGDRSGTIFFGLSSAASPWAPGSTSTLCVHSPVVRTSLLYSGGHHELCDGAFALDWNAWRAAHAPGVYAPGQVLYAQCWFRNSPAPGGSNLSDALRFTVCD